MIVTKEMRQTLLSAETLLETVGLYGALTRSRDGYPTGNSALCTKLASELKVINNKEISIYSVQRLFETELKKLFPLPFFERSLENNECYQCEKVQAAWIGFRMAFFISD